MTEQDWMLRAAALALRGTGFVNPNPLVGCVIVKDGVCIGEGWHEQYGSLHAERNALKNCIENGNDPRGADLYVTLEPCCHYGKNPPCTEAVIAAGISRVFVGSDDPNPLVAGKGILQLRNAGITVKTGVCKEECDKINQIFFHYITHKTPYCILKTAMTADGKTATRTGKSQWISNEYSRQNVHETRKRVAAILCGIGTVLKDDPMLNCRTEHPSHPVRVVCDSQLRIPLSSKLVQTAREIPVLIACAKDDSQKRTQLEAAGAEVILLPGADGRVDLPALMQELGKRGLDSVLIEGGAELHAGALQAKIVQQVQIYLAPMIFGGKAAKTAIGGLGVDEIADAVRLGSPDITRFADDILLEYPVLEE